MEYTPIKISAWHQMQNEAKQAALSDPILEPFLYSAILSCPSFEYALALRLARKLGGCDLDCDQLFKQIINVYDLNGDIIAAAELDAFATVERDPASHRLVEPMLFFKGYQALQSYRIAHFYWVKGRHDFARLLQMRISEVFGVDIHPGAKVGKGILIDHAHSIVFGETVVVGDNVSMLHSVTLGGTGKEDGDRHPKIGSGVLIGAGAKVLGNIHVGNCSRIAAGSVVLSDVPPGKTVAGVPAKIVGEAGCPEPFNSMDHII